MGDWSWSVSSIYELWKMTYPELKRKLSKAKNRAYTFIAAAAAAAKLLRSCPTLCDPMDCSPPGSSARGIFQARVLEWVAFSDMFTDGKLILAYINWERIKLEYVPEDNEKNWLRRRKYKKISQTLKMTNWRNPTSRKFQRILFNVNRKKYIYNWYVTNA